MENSFDSGKCCELLKTSQHSENNLIEEMTIWKNSIDFGSKKDF